MRVYFAAPWKWRQLAKASATVILEAGHEVVSRWHDEWGAVEGDDDKDDNVMRSEAEKDFYDVQDAEVLIVLNIEKSEGKAVEQGIALAMGIPIIAVGTVKTNVFQYLPCYVWVETIEDAMKVLRGDIL